MRSAVALHSHMLRMVKISWDVEPSISFTGTNCIKVFEQPPSEQAADLSQKQGNRSLPFLPLFTCFFPPDEKMLIPDEGTERELLLAWRSQCDSWECIFVSWSEKDSQCVKRKVVGTHRHTHKLKYHYIDFASCIFLLFILALFLSLNYCCYYYHSHINNNSWSHALH